MNKTYIIGAIVLIVVAVLFVSLGSDEAPIAADRQPASTTETVKPAAERSAEITDGTYAVQAEESRVLWAGRKPLIGGYINTGSIAVSEGTLQVRGDVVDGSFTIAMQTLSVSETPTKPGSESALQGHLQGERWFDVATYPTAVFTITKTTPLSDAGDTTHQIDGTLTIKDKTNPVSFPAKVWSDTSGTLHASGNFEIDRTLWGITTGSASFFDNLADNAISDTVALSFTLTAKPAVQ